MNDRQTYRLRAPASGREAIAVVNGDGVYVDSVSGEEMEPVTRTLPLAPSDSALLRTPDPVLVALDEITDPQNLGAVCRSAECTGATGVILPERRSAEVTAAV